MLGRRVEADTPPPLLGDPLKARCNNSPADPASIMESACQSGGVIKSITHVLNQFTAFLAAVPIVMRTTEDVSSLGNMPLGVSSSSPPLPPLPPPYVSSTAKSSATSVGEKKEAGGKCRRVKACIEVRRASRCGGRTSW